MEHIWTTQNGNKIKVKDMTIQHIKNCIRCIEEGRINFIINMGWAEDNDYQMYDDMHTRIMQKDCKMEHI